MKLQIWMVAMLAGASLSAHAALFSYNWNSENTSGLDLLPATIPDADENGYVNNQVISDAIQGNDPFLPNPHIVNVVAVRLDISGGWNGNLYAYLRHETADGVGFTTLLNLVGVDESNPLGYTTAGMKVTLTESTGADIHTVETPTVNGTYQVDQTGSSVTFNSFQNLDPNGTWSLFLADLQGNHVSTLNGWGLDLEVVPEPTTWALIIFGSLGGVVGIGKLVRRRWRPAGNGF